MNSKLLLTKSNNWLDFKQNLKNLPTKQKGDAFELLTKLFLQIDPKYLTELKKVWLLDEVPEKLKKYLNLPATDQGVDLIAETKTGEYWTIQCKYRENEIKPITWREISTFAGLSFSVCKNISFGLICTTTERYPNVLKEQENIGFCTSEVWQHLDEGFFKEVKALIGNKPIKLEQLKPRPHQQKAIRNAIKYFIESKQSRGKMIMPCGSGKSLTAFWIADKVKAKTILIAVPSLALIRQTLEVWLREFIAKNKNVSWICVCSDKSVGEMEKDDIILYTQDLGIPCVTDIKEINKWYKDTPKDNIKVVFTTYQSGKVIAAASRKLKINYDIGIMDEAHKTVGQKEKLFTHLLDDNNISIKKRLFMTATERRYAGKSDEIVSMDNPKIYGDTFELLSFKEAMETRPAILSDYKIVTIFVNQDEIAELIKKNVFIRPEKGNWDQEIEADALASVIALRKAMQKYPIRHALSFHSSIKRAELYKDNQINFSKYIHGYSKLETFHVSGHTPTSTRHRIINEFAKSERALITNARCLTEGVDVPNIDCVLFADPKKSTIDIVQAVGRALRPAKNKKYGYIIIPVLLNDLNKKEKVLEQSVFSYILTILRALASNDERIIEYFRAISQGRKPANGHLINIEIDERYAQSVDVNEFERSIQLYAWSKLAKLSWRSFEEARKFVWNLKLKNQNGWQLYVSRKIKSLPHLPFDIPKDPSKTYINKGWKGFGDWLGTGRVANQDRMFLPFEKAKKFVRSLNLKSLNEWQLYCQGKLKNYKPIPLNIPRDPYNAYMDKGWKGIGDWLGTGFIAFSKRKYRSYESAKRFANKLKLKSQKEWFNYCRGKLKEKPNLPSLPSDIPQNACSTYKNNGWTSWGDWLGTKTRRGGYLNYEDAKKFVHGLKLETIKEWKDYCKGKIKNLPPKPDNIPMNIHNIYKDKGWKGIRVWLGSGFIPFNERKYRNYEEARKFVHKLKLKSQKEWYDYCKDKIKNKPPLPLDIPIDPRRRYKNKGWQDIGDWLGSGFVAFNKRKYRSFEEARKFVHKLKLKNQNEWRNYRKGKIENKFLLPIDIPTSPDKRYKDKGWKSWGDFLGTGFIANQLRVYKTYQDAKKYVNRLKIKSEKEWRKYDKTKLPKDIPANPYQTYKNKGWVSWTDWFGRK